MLSASTTVTLRSQALFLDCRLTRTPGQGPGRANLSPARCSTAAYTPRISCPQPLGAPEPIAPRFQLWLLYDWSSPRRRCCGLLFVGSDAASVAVRGRAPFGHQPRRDPASDRHPRAAPCRQRGSVVRKAKYGWCALGQLPESAARTWSSYAATPGGRGNRQRASCDRDIHRPPATRCAS